MTAKQVIEQLQKVDPDTIVVRDTRAGVFEVGAVLIGFVGARSYADAYRFGFEFQENGSQAFLKGPIIQKAVML